MLNIGGGELLVILIVGLVVLGPAKLPEVARYVGRMTRELRRLSGTFQAEMQSALDEPVEELARERGKEVSGSEEHPGGATKQNKGVGVGDNSSSVPNAPAKSKTTYDDQEFSSAAKAGMYDVSPDRAVPSIQNLSEAEAAGLYGTGLEQDQEKEQRDNTQGSA